MENTTSTESTPKPLRKAPWVAALLGISVSQVYTMAREEPPQIPVVRIAGRVRFDEDEIMAYVRSQSLPANGSERAS